MTIPLPSPWADTQDGVQRNLDALAGQFPLGPHQSHHQIYPQARVYKAGTFSHNESPQKQAITFDTERWDYYPAGYTEQHSTSSNSSRLTCRVPGLYTIGGWFAWDGNATGVRYGYVTLNGSTDLCMVGGLSATVAGGYYMTLGTLWRLAVGDYVELMAFSNSGGTRTISAGAEFWFGWISP